MRVLLVAEGQHELGGALQKFVRRLRTDELVIETDIAGSKLLRAHHGSGRGFFKRAVRWMLEAERLGFDAIVFLVDEDRDEQRIRDLAEAQRHPLGIGRRALGAAIHSFDAWMLADEKALSMAFRCNVSRQPQPESINDPKSVVKELRDQAGAEASLAHLYAMIAEAIDLQILEQRCPKGFKVFADRVRAM